MSRYFTPLLWAWKVVELKSDRTFWCILCPLICQDMLYLHIFLCGNDRNKKKKKMSPHYDDFLVFCSLEFFCLVDQWKARIHQYRHFAPYVIFCVLEIQYTIHIATCWWVRPQFVLGMNWVTRCYVISRRLYECRTYLSSEITNFVKCQNNFYECQSCHVFRIEFSVLLL